MAVRVEGYDRACVFVSVKRCTEMEGPLAVRGGQVRM